MEIICCLDEQLELSRQENSTLFFKVSGKHDDFYLDVLTGAYNRRFYEKNKTSNNSCRNCYARCG